VRTSNDLAAATAEQQPAGLTRTAFCSTHLLVSLTHSQVCWSATSIARRLLVENETRDTGHWRGWPFDSSLVELGYLSHTPI